MFSKRNILFLHFSQFQSFHVLTISLSCNPVKQILNIPYKPACHSEYNTLYIASLWLTLSAIHDDLKQTICVWYCSKAESSTKTRYQLYQRFLGLTSFQACKNHTLQLPTAVETRGSVMECVYIFCVYVSMWIYKCVLSDMTVSVGNLLRVNVKWSVQMIHALWL